MNAQYDCIRFVSCKVISSLIVLHYYYGRFFQTPLLLKNCTASSDEFFCEPTVVLPFHSGTAVAVLGGSDIYSSLKKVLRAQWYGAAAVIIVIDQLVSISNNSSTN